MSKKEVDLGNCLDKFSERLELDHLGISEERYERVYNDFRADIEFDFSFASFHAGEPILLYFEHPTKPFEQLETYQQQLVNESESIDINYEILNHLYEATLFMYVSCAMNIPKSPVTVYEVDDFKRTNFGSSRAVEFKYGNSSFRISCDVEECAVGEQDFKVRRWWLEGLENSN